MGRRGGVCVFVLASLMTHGPQSEGRRLGGADGAAAQGAEQDHGDARGPQARPNVRTLPASSFQFLCISLLRSSAPPHRYRQNELKEGAQRSVGRQYFYIDYQSFCNVVKWRMAEVRRVIDKGLRNELDSKGYVCTQCRKTFQALEADRLIDFATGTFNCDVC